VKELIPIIAEYAVHPYEDTLEFIVRQFLSLCPADHRIIHSYTERVDPPKAAAETATAASISTVSAPLVTPQRIPSPGHTFQMSAEKAELMMAKSREKQLPTIRVHAVNAIDASEMGAVWDRILADSINDRLVYD
jgi:hypothetical protein